MSGEVGGLIDEMKVVETVIVFTVFAVLFSLMRSFLDFPIGIFHAAIPAGLFFTINAAKYIHDEYF